MGRSIGMGWEGKGAWGGGEGGEGAWGGEAGLREGGGGNGLSCCCTTSHDLGDICIEVTLKPIFHWKLGLRLGTQHNLYSTDLCWGLASGVTQILCFALGDTNV